MKDKTDYEKLCKAFETVVGWFENETSKSVTQVDTDELGKVADIIKDLADAKKNCSETEKNEWEQCYYAHVIMAMERAGDDEEGMENRYGYVPPKMNKATERSRIRQWAHDPKMYNHEMSERYDRENERSDQRYGKPYREYLDARKHYTETKSARDKEDMEMYANEHMMDTIGTIREMYRTAEPDLKKRMKADLTKLVGEMPT